MNKEGMKNMVKELNDVVAIKDTKELKKFLKPLYIIDNYTITAKDYIYFQESIYNIIKGCIEHKECREYPVKFKFYTKDTKTYTLQLRHFLVNVFLWYPFVNSDSISAGCISSGNVVCIISLNLLLLLNHSKNTSVPIVTFIIKEKSIDILLRLYNTSDTDLFTVVFLIL